MRVTELITKLISPIKDPEMRVNVASTINYLLDVYSSGGAKEEDIRNDLYEIIETVISATMPEKTREEITKIAKDKADEFVRAFKMEGLLRRAVSKYRVPLP